VPARPDSLAGVPTSLVHAPGSGFPLHRRVTTWTAAGFIVGGLGGLGALALVACGGSDDDGVGRPGARDAGPDDTRAGDTAPGGPDGDATIALAQLFDPSPTYARRRSTPTTALRAVGPPAGSAGRPPAELSFQLYAEVDEVGGLPIGDPVVAEHRHQGLPRGYYAVRFTPDRPGIWLAQTEVAGQVLQATFQVGPEGGPGVVPVGAPMPAPTTATENDDLDVTPLCTRDEPCGFHEHSLDAVVGQGTPVVVSVSTPAYCQTAICGPVLDLLVDVAPAHPGVRFVHLEPWQEPVPGDPFANGPVDAVRALGLDFEPSLFLVDGDGVIVDRLDHVYDAVELQDALAHLGT
jgi:hypothetical protein